MGLKRVARLMRTAGLQGVSRSKHRTTVVRNRDARPAADLVERQFAAAGPDRRWVADITHVPIWTGFLLLAVVLEAWSRRVVGWSMANHLRTELVLDAVNMALEQRCPDGVVHHRDRSNRHSSVSIRSPLDGRAFPNGSETWSWLMPVPCSRSTSRAQRSSQWSEASRAGSGGGSAEPSLAPPRVDVGGEAESKEGTFPLVVNRPQ